MIRSVLLAHARAELAPRNKGLVGVSTIIDPKNCYDSEEKLLNTIYSLVPALEKNTEMIHTQIMAPEKAAVSLNYFPSIKTRSTACMLWELIPICEAWA